MSRYADDRDWLPEELREPGPEKCPWCRGRGLEMDRFGDMLQCPDCQGTGYKIPTQTDDANEDDDYQNENED